MKCRIALLLSVLGLLLLGKTPGASSQSSSTRGYARIVVDAKTPVGTVWDNFFGQNIEYEHGAISGGEQNQDHAHGLHTGGLWAEMLRDRKFEEGDVDQDGVANAWVPEERITNRYEKLHFSKGPTHRYFVDHQEYYGGGASQAIELSDDGSDHASIYQIQLHFTQGLKYTFYVYLKTNGKQTAWVEFSNPWKKDVYDHHDLGPVADGWNKYTAEFTALETTDDGRVGIGIKGNGTVWIDSASLMPADNFHGIRKDVIAATKPLRLPLLRYPGGCFADGYHWQDGIADRDKRPERWSSFWNEWEPNDFGFDDFMLFSQQVGVDPQITLNALTGSAEEAAQWVQYSNGSVDTPMGKLRAANGHPDPYNIKLWAVGNEVQEHCSGQYIGRNDPAKYAKQYQDYGTLIHNEDPSITLMAVGAGPGPLEWNHNLLSLLPSVPPLLGVSIYTGEGERIDDFDTKIVDLQQFYRHVVAEHQDFEKQLNDVVASVGNRVPPDRPLIAVTEFQSWWLTEKVDEDLRLCDALYLASVYHTLFRHSKQVALAEIESLIDVQGVIEANQTSLKLTPEYFASLLYREHTGKTVLATTTDTPEVPFNAELPMLDAIATESADKHTLYVAVVNRAESGSLNTTLQIKGRNVRGSSARVYELNGKRGVAANPFGSTDSVNIRQRSLQVAGNSISYTFPAHSVTILEIGGGM